MLYLSQKAAPIGVEKLAYARLLNILAIIQISFIVIQISSFLMLDMSLSFT